MKRGLTTDQEMKCQEKQQCIRDLIEAGVPFVQANMGPVQHWDTHVAHFIRVKQLLLPPLDQGLSALLDDLRESGRIEKALVVVTGEFGRTPKISTLPGRCGTQSLVQCFFRSIRRCWSQRGQKFWGDQMKLARIR